MSSWEAERRWEIVRYLVYYLQENFVHPSWVEGKDILDFSCGLGDLSLYMSKHNAKSVVATVPEQNERPLYLKSQDQIEFMPGLDASKISTQFQKNSKDLFVARMVFQFPTMEDHFVDVDEMLKQVFEILRPGGKVIICSHEYTELNDEPELWGLKTEDYLKRVVEIAPRERKQKIKDYVELIKTIGIPPREGLHGQTGFGLKSLMCVDSFVHAGFNLERCDHLEDFTFPRGLSHALSGDEGGDQTHLSQEAEEKQEFEFLIYKELSEKVFEIKKSYILSDEFKDKYKRPRVLQKLLKDISELHSFVSIPIFRVVATKPNN